jgi:hypothetical protein
MLLGGALAQPPEVAVLTGGVGESEQQALVAREREFNLKLVFSLVQGNYVADTNVAISDSRGRKVIERDDVGPFLLARLPAGEYDVEATRGGTTVSRKVKIASDRLRTEHLRWPANLEQDTPVSRWVSKE